MSEKTIGGVMGAALFVFLSWFLALPMLGVSYDTPTGIVVLVLAAAIGYLLGTKLKDLNLDDFDPDPFVD